MGFSENEVAADNERRKLEEASKSSVGGLIENAALLARSSLAVGAAVIATGASSATRLAVAGSVVSAFGIVDWFRKLGGAKVDENLELLGQATEDALNRVENILREQGASIGEIKARIESQEFAEGMASASLQALRTTQGGRLKRMARILANGVRENDLEPESLDDMMRAAVELKSKDIELLGTLNKSQAGILKSYQSLSSEWSQQVAASWPNDFSFLDSPGSREARSSLARLQSAGLVQEVRTMMTPTGRAASQPFGLLPEGQRFFERIREVVSDQRR
jgi:hypothetical protein